MHSRGPRGLECIYSHRFFILSASSPFMFLLTGVEGSVGLAICGRRLHPPSVTLMSTPAPPSRDAHDNCHLITRSGPPPACALFNQNFICLLSCSYQQQQSTASFQPAELYHHILSHYNLVINHLPTSLHYIHQETQDGILSTRLSQGLCCSVNPPR